MGILFAYGVKNMERDSAILGADFIYQIRDNLTILLGEKLPDNAG